jgi:hypothetical protein
MRSVREKGEKVKKPKEVECKEKVRKTYRG